MKKAPQTGTGLAPFSFFDLLRDFESGRRVQAAGTAPPKFSLAWGKKLFGVKCNGMNDI
jgi:hypothetical protein